jgi:hypothetical protein
MVTSAAPGFTSTGGTLGHWSTEAPDDFDFSGDEDGYWPVSRLRQGYLDYLTAKVEEYEEAKQSRHYYHAAQWTPDEIKILRARRQPITTYNRVSRKINSIVTLVQRLRQDPKAVPRHPNNAQGCEIATESIRTVLDGNQFKNLDFMACRQAATEGIGGVELKLIDGDRGDPDVGIGFVFGDDFFYDPRSMMPDFSDARYMGIAKWLDVEAAIELFPDKEEVLRTLMVETGFDLTTHADREYKWIYVNEKRLRLVEQWYKHKGRWNWAFYCSTILLAQGVSPFLDERRRPMNRFVMFSAAVDHDGDRYGFPRNLKGPQDELNQRKSKALHISNTTRLILQKGAVDDVERARQEYARPDGLVEYNPGFEQPKPDDKTVELQAHLSLMQDARAEIDSFANINAGNLSPDDGGDQSGVAINLLQKAGVADIGDFILAYKDWKLRLYRAIWNIVQRTWQAERFIRVSSDEELAQFIQINGMREDEFGNPTLVNFLGALDVDIILDDGPDSASLLTEAWEMVRQDPSIPFQVKLELMPIAKSKKERIAQMLQQQPDPLAVQEKQLENEVLAAMVGEKRAGTMHRVAQAQKALADAHATESGALTDAITTIHSLEQDNPLPQPPGPIQQGPIPVPQGLPRAAGFTGFPPQTPPQPGAPNPSAPPPF